MNASFGPFLVIVLGLLLGMMLRRTRHLPTDAPKVLNAYVITVAVPALVLAQLPPFLRELAAHGERVDASLIFLFRGCFLAARSRFLECCTASG